MLRTEWWLAATVGFVLTMCAVAQARADHGTWETERVWVEPVIESRSVWIPGRWEDHSVWVPGRWVTRTRTLEERVWQSRMVWVVSGHWEERLQWVKRGYWSEVEDDDGVGIDFVWVDTSRWEFQKIWVDTSQWQDHGAWITEQREEATRVWVPGHWTTERRWIAGNYETRRVVVSPGHYESRRRWVSLPHPAPTPIPAARPRPDCRTPSGIHKVIDYYAGTTVEASDTGIRYGTVTDNRPNDLYAVDLGSYSKGVRSPYDGAAFNGRKLDVNGELLAGTFYRNYRKRNGCFVPTSIVFFQDDRVRFTTGTLPTPTSTPAAQASPTPTPTPTAPIEDPVIGDPAIADPDHGSSRNGSDGPKVDSVPTTSAGPGSTPTQRPGSPITPTAKPTPRPPDGRPPSKKPPRSAHDPPAGTVHVAPVLAGAATSADAAGFRAIEVLRGAPIDLWVRLAVTPPASDLGATVELEQWTLVRGENDRPGGTRPGDTGGASERLRFQWNDVTPVVDGRLEPYTIHLRARIRVTYSDGAFRSFDLNESIAVTVRFQGATTWENGR